MKTITKIILLLAVVLTFGACGNWLDVISKSDVSIDDMYSNADGYYSTVTGVYINMGKSTLYGGSVSLSALEPLTDQYSISANNPARQKWAKYDYTAKESQDIIDDIWGDMYNNIVNANLIIERLRAETRPLFQNGVREIMLAEMLGMRAYMYFDLARMFNEPYVVNKLSNNVPLKRNFGSEIGQRVTSEALIVSLMTDLDEAQELLLKNDPIVSSKRYSDVYVAYDRSKRMNYYAVTALIARISLYTSDYKTAYENAKIVCEAPVFRFMREEDIIITDPYGNEIKVDRVFLPEMVFALDTEEVLTTSSKYYDGLSEDAIKSWGCYETATDIRRKWFIMNSMNKINMIRYKGAKLDAEKSKYIKPTVPMMKLSEMCLICEEAMLNDNTISDTPLTYINRIKTNRKATTIVATDRATIEKEIMHEYICDFKGEGQLFLYYKRLNKTEIDNGFYNGNITQIKTENFTFPRPQDENDFGN